MLVKEILILDICRVQAVYNTANLRSVGLQFGTTLPNLCLQTVNFHLDSNTKGVMVYQVTINNNVNISTIPTFKIMNVMRIGIVTD